MKNFGRGMADYFQFIINAETKYADAYFSARKENNKMDINITINNHFKSKMMDPVTFIK